MKLRIIPLILFLCLLCSCGSGPDADEQALELRARLIAAKLITAEATLRADYGEYVCDFGLLLEADADSAAVTLLSPDSVAGVSATVENGSAVLRFDGVTLTTGELYGSGITPVEALPAMLNCWRYALISESVFEQTDEGMLLRISCEAESGATHRLWCSAESLTPLRAEVMSGGKRVLSCEFADFTIQ